jgi:hypothetical protein
MDSRRLRPSLLGLIAAGLIAVGCASTDDGRIKVYSGNPHYWEYKGEPLLLLGGSDEDNLFNNPELMTDNFETMSRVGANYIRGTLSYRDEGNVFPYLKNGDLFDLERFNPEFFSRLEDCCRQAEARDIIVQIEIWPTFDFYRDRWPQSPYNPAANVNYTTENTKLVTEWDYHPARRVQPFFYSPPGLNHDRTLLRYQEAFVKKVLDITQSFPNILYCLDNETKAPAGWPLYWGAFFKKEGDKRGIDFQLTEMWDPWDLTDSMHRLTYQHHGFFSYADVSQNNWQVGQTHYDRLMFYRGLLDEQPGGPRPMNNVKVYSRQGGGKPNSVPITVDRWWQNVFAGCASTRFHRPTGGIGLDTTAQKVIQAARTFTDSFDIFSCAPHPDLISNRDDNEAYCLADPGVTYALYFPKGGEVTLTVPAGKGCRLRWFDPENASFMEAETNTDGGEVELKSPNRNQTWLVLVEVN